MEDLRKDAIPIPNFLSQENAEGKVDETAELTFCVERKMPRFVHMNNCKGIHIGPSLNCIDPASIRAPPPGSACPSPWFGSGSKRCPPKYHVEALLGCSSEVDDVVKDIVSEHIGYGWRTLGRHMNYSEGQLDNMESNCQRTIDKAFKLLTYWHDREASNATVANLTRLLMKSSAFDVVMRLHP